MATAAATASVTSCRLSGRLPMTINIVVIAHPDDESMFFLPYIVNKSNGIEQRKNKKKQKQQEQEQEQDQQEQEEDDNEELLWLLCLTSGNYNGLGTTRIQELFRVNSTILQSAFTKIIVLHDEVFFPDHPDHSIAIKEDTTGSDDATTTTIHDIFRTIIHSTIQDMEREYYQDNDMDDGVHEPTNSNQSYSSSSVSQQPQQQQRRQRRHTMLNFITFDQYGVSNHINHIDTYRIVKKYYMLHHHYHRTKKQTNNNNNHYNNNNNSIHDNSMASATATTTTMNVYTLKTIHNPIIKYIPLLHWIRFLYYSILSFFVSCSLLSSLLSFSTKSTNTTATTTTTTYYSLYIPYTYNWQAMATHASQFVWYRRLFVVFSIYTYCNVLTLLQVNEDDESEIEYNHASTSITTHRDRAATTKTALKDDTETIDSEHQNDISVSSLLSQYRITTYNETTTISNANQRTNNKNNNTIDTVTTTTTATVQYQIYERISNDESDKREQENGNDPGVSSSKSSSSFRLLNLNRPHHYNIDDNENCAIITNNTINKKTL